MLSSATDEGAGDDQLGLGGDAAIMLRLFVGPTSSSRRGTCCVYLAE